MVSMEDIQDRKVSFLQAKSFVAENVDALSKLAYQVTQNLTASGTFFSQEDYEIAFETALNSSNKNKTGLNLDLPKDKAVLGFVQSQCVALALENSPSRETEAGTLYSSKELLEAEQKIIATALKMSSKEGCENQPFQTASQLNSALDFFNENGQYGLGDSHRSSLEDLLKPGNLKVLSGPPGSGKSTIAQGVYMSLVKAALDNGEEMPAFYTTAPTVKASAGILEDMSAIKSSEKLNQKNPDFVEKMPEIKGTPTVDEMIEGLAQGEIPKGAIVMVDEAGLMGSKQMAALLENADKAGVRLFMMGDHLQLPPKLAGCGLDLMLQNADAINLDSTELKVVMRQKRDNEADWTLAIRAKKSLEALNGYENRRYADLDTRQTPDAKYVPELTDGTDVGTPGLQSLKDNDAIYSELTNDFIRFRQQNPNASSIVMGTDEASAYNLNVFMREEMKRQGLITDVRRISSGNKLMEVGVGDTLMLSVPIKMGDSLLSAGSQVSVEGFKGDVTTVRLGKNSYEVKSKMLAGSSDYGLALSLHQAQGQTKDRAFLAIDKTGQMDQALGGVAFSRHLHQMSAYVSKEAYPNLGSLADEMSEFRVRQKLLSDNKGIEILNEKAPNFVENVSAGLKKMSLQSAIKAKEQSKVNVSRLKIAEKTGNSI